MSNPAIEIGEVMEMQLQLHQFDVTEGNWAFNKEPWHVNLGHVGHHLGKGALSKDYLDPNVVRTEVAPDDLQYALRIARWCRFSPEVILEENPVVIAEVGGILKRNAISQLSIAHRRTAEAIIDSIKHDHEHLIVEGQEPSFTVLEPVIRTAQHLARAAIIDSEVHGFELGKAFNDRLDFLRIEFARK